jgi:iron complex outermembrane recepter protein
MHLLNCSDRRASASSGPDTGYVHAADLRLSRLRSRCLLPCAAALVLGCAVTGTAAANAVADAAGASANTNSESSTSGGALQEITVTARRITENLEKVPVAVEALSSQALAEQNITTEQDLEAAVPGLLVRNATSTSQENFAIRGQAVDAFSYTSPAVLAYLDEFQVGGTVANTYYDLQSVQVLKGPQGTLFGRNSTGGAVLYTTTQPGNTLTGYLDGTVGNYRDKKAEGAITLPLADWASFRLAGETENRDGYEHNVYLNLYDGSIENRNIRGTLRLGQDNGFENVTTVQYGSQGGYSGVEKITHAYINCPPTPPAPSCAGSELYPPNLPTLGYNPALLAKYNGILNFINYQATQPFWNVYDDQSGGLNATLLTGVNKTTYAINDDLTVKNIVGYNRVKSQQQNDVVGSPFALLPISATPGPTSEGYGFATEQYSDELQLLGTAFAKRLNYIVGLYYLRDNEGQDIPLNEGCGSIAFQPPTPANPYACAVPGGFRYDFENDEESRAAFGQVSYEILDGLHLTGGYRETWENVDFQYLHGENPQDSHFLAHIPEPSLSDNHPSWTLGIDYQLTPDALIYVAQRGSFRVGGFNGTSSIPTPSGPQIDSFRPELARDVELGVKFSGHIFDLPARINADVYEERITDAQRVVYFGISSQTTNAAAARVDGFEFQGLVDLTTWLQAGINYAYTDARYTDGRAPFTTINVLSGAITTGIITLGPYADTPKQSGSLFLRVSQLLPNNLGQLVVRGDAFFQTDFYYTNLAASLPIPLDPDTRIPGYTLLNARLEWNDIAGSKVHLAAFGQNLANKQYETGGLGLGAVVGTDAVILGLPRMYGLEAGVRF